MVRRVLFILPSGKEKAMKHTLKICVSKHPASRGVVACRSMTIRERFLRLLFGDKAKLTVIVPGDTVSELDIREIRGDPTHEAV